MNNRIIVGGLVVIIVLLIFFRRSNYQRAGRDTTIIKEITQAPKPTQPIYKKNDNKFYITINANSNNFRYDFQRVIKNIKHIEVVSAIVPKSTYRINESNNVIPLRVNGSIALLQLTQGVYDNISTIMLEFNRQIKLAIDDPSSYFSGTPPTFPNQSYINILFNSMTRKCYIIASNDIGTVEFLWSSASNTCSRAFGFVSDIIVNQGTTYEVDFVETSILFQTATYDNTVQVNNYPSSYYQGLAMFPNGGNGQVVDNSFFAYGQDRVNLSSQLFVDISAKEISYFDGNNVIQQVYIPENKSLVNYQRQYPIYRRLKSGIIDLDHITLKFESIIEPGLKRAYDFNGIDYSVQLELVTTELDLNATK